MRSKVHMFVFMSKEDVIAHLFQTKIITTQLFPLGYILSQTLYKAILIKNVIKVTQVTLCAVCFLFYSCSKAFLQIFMIITLISV